jgi:NOL1/NOP2/fmu family ribosome biogenesis protein
LVRLNRKEEEQVRDWVRPVPLFYFKHQEYSYGLPLSLAEDLALLQSSCYLKRAGVLLGKPGAKEFIPEHALALSVLINPDLPAIPLSREQAIQYLRKEEVHTGSAHRGWALVQYGGQNLGWIKVLPNRSNNYYPKEWRILKRDE